MRYSLLDDTDSSISYTGNWTVLSVINPANPEYNGTVHATNDPSATLTLKCHDCAIINAYGTLDKPSPNGLPSSFWSLDNTVPSSFKNPNVTEPDKITSHVKFYGSGKLVQGDHNLTITFTGLNATGPTFYIDFFAVQVGDNSFSEEVILDAKDTQWVYPGWQQENTPGSYGGSVQIPPLDEASDATLPFHGTSISIYGSVNTTTPQDEVIGVFQVDGGRPHTVFAANLTTPTTTAATATPTLFENQEIFRTTGLDDIGQYQHTLTVSVPAASTVVWGMDYAVYGPSSALTTSTPTSTNSSTSSSSHKPNGGAIAGGVIGALAVVAAIILAFFFIRRRSKRIAQEQEARQFPSTTDGQTTESSTLPVVASKRKRRRSIQKGSRSGDSQQQMEEAREAPILDISATSPMMTTATVAATHGRTESSTLTFGPSTAQSAYDYSRPAPIRETDGGVRLASGDEDEESEVLPPQYARY